MIYLVKSHIQHSRLKTTEESTRNTPKGAVSGPARRGKSRRCSLSWRTVTVWGTQASRRLQTVVIGRAAAGTTRERTHELDVCGKEKGRLEQAIAAMVFKPIVGCCRLCVPMNAAKSLALELQQWKCREIHPSARAGFAIGSFGLWVMARTSANTISFNSY